jgi:6-O-methylguanine DNA methyltransferase, DNA binding domain
LIVPCHRVIRTGGALGGYAFGLDCKRWLLAHESTKLSLFHGKPRRDEGADTVAEVAEDLGGDLQPATA